MPDFEHARRLYRNILRIRRTEELLAKRYTEQEMRCPMHLCIGQEAIAVGVCDAMQAGDKVFSNHRAHGHYLAKGGSLYAMVAEIYGHSDGCCGGRGGSMHLIDPSAGFMGSTPIVGGTIPLAAGTAWASSLRQSGEVTAVFFGDGCFEEGVMHEAMNFAALHKLPILFICENNNFSVYTRLEARQPKRPIYRIAEAHGMTATCGDGNDVELVRELAEHAISNARSGEGPQFLELQAYRWREHCGPNFDHDLEYRTPEEIEAGTRDCPLAAYRRKLNTRFTNFDSHADALEQEIDTELTDIFERVLANSPTRRRITSVEMAHA